MMLTCPDVRALAGCRFQIVDLVRKLTQNMSHYQVDRAVQEAKMREAAVVQRGPVDPSNPAEDDNMPEVPTRIQPEATSSAAASQFSSPVAIQPLTVLRSYTPEPDTEVDIVPAPTLGKGKETLRRSTSQRSDIKVALSSDELPQKLRKELEYMQMHHTDELKQKSSRVVIELVDTERNYRNGLKTLLDLYRDRLRDSGLLKPIDIDTIFGVIPDLYRLSCDLYTQFCEALKRFEEEPYGITACFLEQIERWKIYIIYVKKFSGAKRLLREMEDKNEAFSNLLEEIQRMPECRRQDIHQFLHLPIQRMSSYWLLLDRLGKCCDRSDIQWERINGTAEYIFQIGYLLNTAQREEENVYKMFKVQQTVKNCPADLVSFSQRSYIDEFQVLDDIQRTRIMTIFLFTDCILITVDRRSMIKGDRWKYELVEKIDFKSIANELPIYFKGDDNCVLQWQTRLVSEPPPPAPASDRRANSTSKFGLSSFLNRNASSSVAENVTSPPGSSSDPGRRHPDGSSPTHARQQAYYVRFSQVAERDRFVEVVGQAFDRFKK
ncbi:rho guanine nucleotide exchange factor [Polychytrium aggregatum]|uniref:rho guanine nucleotide exchange factor n=1 Tax=Polychytrium aggregatum TaxID=110093 RepID=UPI0022FDC239|nr:rho guanine nucleotide exchange factor [Polychytrium aggregatum]KAI9193706.1 Dbl homology domain-containing protein [Polychytrium aggregatum]